MVLGVPAARAAVTPGSSAQRSNVAGLSNADYMNAFVARHGARLTVAGRPFRFSGANVEWLGLENYGPNASTQLPVGSEHYATPYEINDAFATLHELGASVVRVQTLGDTAGCPLCEEPARGQFNPAAFHQTDLVIAAARRWGIKLIGEFDGDANGSKPSGSTAAQFETHNWYCTWEGTSTCGSSFFSDPKLIADYEQHMHSVLDHVNPYTGLAYKDDPTIMGWVDGNNLDLLDGAPPTTVARWLSTVSAYYKSIDSRQLFIDISLNGADATPLPLELGIPGVDVFAQEYYPHWFPGIDGDRVDGSAPNLHHNAATVAAAGKAYATIEFGWDRTDFASQGALTQFLDGLWADPNVAGDDFWALAGHAPGHGWQPIPANANCSPTCETGEDGNWWAMYYTGLRTLSNTATDMTARAQLLRAHAYAMSGFSATPAHERVPAPVITSVSPTGRVLFEGSAGAPIYAIQRHVHGRWWSTPCRRCTTDAAGGWRDPRGRTGCYRVIGVNLAGVPGPASRPRGRGCPQSAARRRRAKRRPRPGRSRAASSTTNASAPALPSWAIGPFTRYRGNPILRPQGTGWESLEAFNPGVVRVGGVYHMLYRGTRPVNISEIGAATSTDGIHFNRYAGNPVIGRRVSDESVASEDPRLLYRHRTFYAFYTGFDGSSTNINEATSTDAIHWHELGAAVPGVKDAAVVADPEGRPVRVGGRFIMYEGSSIADQAGVGYATSSDMRHWTQRGQIKLGYPGSQIVELCVAVTDYRAVAGAPLNHNVLLFTAGHMQPTDPWYYAISEEEFSSRNPTQRLGQLTGPVLAPTTTYEKLGVTPAAVFMNNIIYADGRWRMYYGAADTVTGLATAGLRRSP
jgi:predicted GH43/DUF377 family glycosyl hydrolase